MTSALLLLPAVAFAGWVSWLAWLGRWKAAAIWLGIPLGLAAMLWVAAASGALNSGRSEDWGPLMAMIAAAAIAITAVVSAIIAGIVGLTAHFLRESAASNSMDKEAN